MHYHKLNKNINASYQHQQPNKRKANQPNKETHNVTYMNQNKRHSAFIDCMNRNRFTCFIKCKQSSQTHYIVIYKETL